MSQRSLAERAGWWSKVLEVGVLCTGDRLAPTRVKLLVLTTTDLQPSEQDQWVRLSKGWDAKAKAEAAFRVQAPHVDRADACSAIVYRDAIPLYLPELRQNVV